MIRISALGAVAASLLACGTDSPVSTDAQRPDASDSEQVDTAHTAPDSEPSDISSKDTPSDSNPGLPDEALDLVEEDGSDTDTPTPEDSSAPDVDTVHTETDTPTLDPEGDTDRDGIFDLDEVSDGTDPFNPRSARAWHPEISGHPRLFTRPELRPELALRTSRPGAASALWAQVLNTANRIPPTQPASGYDTEMTPAQGLIAESAALIGYLGVEGTNAAAMTSKALDILSAPFPDPTPLNSQSFFNAGDHYNLHESEGLVAMCSAYDLAAGTPDVDPDALAAARANLVHRIDLFRELCFTTGGCTRFLSNEPTNHSLKSLSALGVCAMALPDRPEAAADFNEALGGITYISHERQGDVEGGWAEAWNYLNYSGETHLAFLMALEKNASMQTPASDTWRVRGDGWVTGLDPAIGQMRDIQIPSASPLWRAVYSHALFAAMPNGLMPPVDDGNPSPLHGGLLSALFDDPRFLGNWAMPAVGRHVGRQLVSTFLTLRDDADTPPPMSAPFDGFFAAAGFSVLRASASPDTTWLHVQHEPERMRVGGGAHEHADPLSFILWALGEPLAIDPGYIDYASHKLVRYGKDHNIVLVDGEGPEFFLDGLITAPPNSDGFLHDHEVGPDFSTLSASTKYAGAELRRRYVRIARSGLPEAFVIADRLISDTPRTYTFQLNGLASEEIGGTNFLLTPNPNGGLATFARPKATLYAFTLATTGATTTDSRLEENALAGGRHRCVTVSSPMGPTAGFLTLLVPIAPGPAPSFAADRLADGLVRITLTDTSGVLTAYLNTTGSTQSQAPPGLTIVRSETSGDHQKTFTMDLPPIPDPTPFIPE